MKNICQDMKELADETYKIVINIEQCDRFVIKNPLNNK